MLGPQVSREQNRCVPAALAASAGAPAAPPPAPFPPARRRSVIRRSTTLCVVCGEFWLFGKRPSRRSLAALLLMVGGAVVAGLTDLTFNPAGYAWVSLCVVSTAAYLLLIRKLQESTGRWCGGVGAGPAGALCLGAQWATGGSVDNAEQWAQRHRCSWGVASFGPGGVLLLHNLLWWHPACGAGLEPPCSVSHPPQRRAPCCCCAAPAFQSYPTPSWPVLHACPPSPPLQACPRTRCCCTTTCWRCR